MLIVIGIIAIVGTGGALYLGNNDPGIRLERTTSRVVTFIRNAQQKATNQEENVRWGVYVDNLDSSQPTLSIFKVVEELAADPDHDGIDGLSMERIILSGNLQLLTPASGTSSDILFAKGTGLPETPRTIVIATADSQIQKTISIDGNGRIDSQ